MRGATRPCCKRCAPYCSCPRPARQAGPRTHPAEPRLFLRAAARGGDLDAIVSKALRGVSRSELRHRRGAEDGRASVSAAPPTRSRRCEGARLYLMGHMLRRHRWAVAALAAIFASWPADSASRHGKRTVHGIERDNARRDAAREQAVRYNLTSMFRCRDRRSRRRADHAQEHDRQQRLQRVLNEVSRSTAAGRSNRAGRWHDLNTARSRWRHRRRRLCCERIYVAQATPRGIPRRSPMRGRS